MSKAVKIYRVIKWFATNRFGWWLICFVIGPGLAWLGILREEDFQLEDIAENVGASDFLQHRQFRR